jgi:beta-N-acetylhexosaminidase
MSRLAWAGVVGGAAALIVVLLLVLGGGNESNAGPEGRSPFRPAGSDTNGRTASGASRASRGHAPVEAPAGGLPTTQARAAARLFLLGFGGSDPGPAVMRHLAAHEWGGVVLEPGNGGSPQQVAGLVGRIRGAAAQERHSSPLIAASQPGGQYDAVPIGSPLPSQAGDAAAVERAALTAARALRPLGVRLVLAPVADTGTSGGPWEGLAYSDEPGPLTASASAAVAGWKQGQVAPAPGHFPGEGAASGDPAVEPATVGLSMDELRARDLKPFAELARHAPAIQLSAATYVAFDGVTPATLLPEVVGLLRGDLGFKGVVISGDLAAASLATGRPVADLAVAAVKAGADLLWVPGDAGDQDAAWRAVVRALRRGEVPVSRVADALKRVSVLRAAYGVR